MTGHAVPAPKDRCRSPRWWAPDHPLLHRARGAPWSGCGRSGQSRRCSVSPGVVDLLDEVAQLDAAPLTHVTQSVESLLGGKPVSFHGAADRHADLPAGDQRRLHDYGQVGAGAESPQRADRQSRWTTVGRDPRTSQRATETTRSWPVRARGCSGAGFSGHHQHESSSWRCGTRLTTGVELEPEAVSGAPAPMRGDVDPVLAVRGRARLHRVGVPPELSTAVRSGRRRDTTRCDTVTAWLAR
jgi:hypothetical protein